MDGDPSTILIRPAITDDHDAIWSILEPIIRAGDVFAFDRDLERAEARARWINRDGEVFVAIRDDVVMGTYYLRPNREGGGRHVCNCGYATAMSASGQGVARTMCRHSLETARSRGYRAMQFNFVVATNERAVRLWQAMGFETVGRLPRAFDHPSRGFVDALVMSRVL